MADGQNEMTGPATSRGAPFWAWYALAVLTFVTLFAYVDRVILALFAEPIRRSMGFSDLQLGLLQGLGVALFAALASYPLGWLSDRFDRRWVLGGCILTWSVAVLGCGLSRDFPSLFVWSAVVGAGEAGLAPVFYSMVPELFGKRQQQLANSIFALSATAAGGFAYAIGGQIPHVAEHLRPVLPALWRGLEGWRLSFLIAAAPAPLMLLLISTVRLQARTGGRGTAAQPRARGGLLTHLRLHSATIGLFFASIGISSVGFQALGAWFPVIMMRDFGQTVSQVGAGLTALTLFATGAGFLASVVVSQAFGKRLGPLLPIRVLWIAYLIATLFVLSLSAVKSAAVVYIVGAAEQSVLITSTMLIPTAIQNLGTRAVRGRLVSFMMIVNALCGACGAPLVGAVSDRFKGAPHGLILSAVGVSIAALALGALAMRLCESRFLRTVEANLAADAADEAAHVA